MIFKHSRFLFLFFLMMLIFSPCLFAQNAKAIATKAIHQKKPFTFSNYNTLESCVNISAEEWPTQIARFPIDRPGFIKKIILHLDGYGKGTFKTHIYGHESGTNYPALSVDLIRPIKKRKRRRGYQVVVIELKKPVFVNNDQFYIALDDFTGDFGLKQDSTFYQEFCCSRDGGDYYPTLLLNPADKYRLENCYLTMDVELEFVAPVSPIFKDVSQAAGIPLNLSNEFIAWGDLDGDNWLDLMVDGHIYKNNQGQFEDITAKVIKNNPAGLRGAAFVDMDNNGRQDILLFGHKKSLLYLNEGKFPFTKKELAIPPLPSLHAFSFADINKDHFLDLILAQLWEPYPVPQPNYLLLNDHQNNFKDITQRLYPEHQGQFNFPQGLECVAEVDSTYFPNNNKNRRSRGSQFTDVDLDGDVDLFIPNYFLEIDEFYINNGQGYFMRTAPPVPMYQDPKLGNNGTGVDWYDFDNDGDFDLLLPQLAHPRYLETENHKTTTIFRNDAGHFTDIKDSHGLEYEETHAGGSFGDVNNDGLVDIAATVYYGCRYVDLYLQQPNHSFKLSTYQSGLSKITTGNDACFVDFDNDGLLDLAMGEQGKFRLFKNIKPTTNTWVKVQLNSISGNHFGIGTIVKVFTNNEVFTQEVNAGRGQRIQKPAILHFGLGAATKIDKIEVLWNSGRIERFLNVPINQAFTLVEGGKSIIH